MSLIVLGEHYAWDPASADNVVATWLRSNNEVAYQRSYDRRPLRLEQMDAAGIDFQILSLFDPGVRAETDTARAIDVARRADDDLAETVRGNPDRFGGFATLATQDPEAAAAELERGVTELGLINGHCQGRYLDDPAYEGLFERAQGMGAPIYLHPTSTASRGDGGMVRPIRSQARLQEPNARAHGYRLTVAAAAVACIAALGDRRVERVHRPSSRYPGRIVREGIARRVT